MQGCAIPVDLPHGPPPHRMVWYVMTASDIASTCPIPLRLFNTRGILLAHVGDGGPSGIGSPLSSEAPPLFKSIVQYEKGGTALEAGGGDTFAANGAGKIAHKHTHTNFLFCLACFASAQFEALRASPGTLEGLVQCISDRAHYWLAAYNIHGPACPPAYTHTHTRQ